MPPPEAARRRERDRRRLVADTVAGARQTWGAVDPAAISATYAMQLPRLVTIVAGAQLAAASGTDEAAGAALAEQGVSSDPLGAVIPAALAGVASDGRDLRTLLDRPRIAMLRGLGSGLPASKALATGWAGLEMIVRTQVADAGRVADGIAVASRPGVGWVRMVHAPCCPRCAVLAGRWYRYSNGFERHPQCDCTHIPAPEAGSGDLRTDPKGLLREGQIRGLSKADAKSILEDGADMGRVINAHRGMYTAAGNRKLTTELSAVGRQRLRPEQIYRDTTSRSDAIRLLKLHGYII